MFEQHLFITHDNNLLIKKKRLTYLEKQLPYKISVFYKAISKGKSEVK